MKRSCKLLLAGAASALLLVGACFWECHDLPGVSEIRSQLFTRYVPKGRSTWVPLWAISPKLQVAVVVWEDPQFYFHHGFVYDEIWRALIEDVRSGHYRRGASTISQQVAKNLFLTSEKSLSRKLREAVLTRRIERALSKDEILEVYLNIADWGDGIVGAEAAARFYFSRSAEDLSWAEAALLAGILSNPHRYNPRVAPQEALRRRQMVLIQLLLNQALKPDEFRQAFSAPL
jgi:monofunctional biosynthetic peptidoglycan transglycosylase